ncbi:AlbA family DNA-binding domain-containing protein [Sutcliffiella cohnii]|uniref:AlbA family DNA-binding domain-containing protein n=1 Tax=Sutcliffiella cohnii TaxID=33932 RepID=UPI00082DC7F2|nr:ATP-binding protein [Sutcliffiella cohnii]
MLDKPFNELSLEDVLALKINGVEEGKSIDFKLEVQLDIPKNRKEFAADITSFANTTGGDLIIGVSEEQGLIKELHGIEITDKDKFLQRIESILRDAVDPQITGLDMNLYPIEEQNKYILHIRVPQSYVGPHIVNGEKFYGRNNAGKYQLDFVEIKQRFTLSNQVQEKIKQYHLERIMKIKANEGYWELQDGGALLINIVPLQSFSESVYVSALTQTRFKLNTLFGDGSYNPKIQFEGIAGLYHSSYHHINRQGIIEIADKHLLKINQQYDTKIYAKPIIERILKIIPNAFLNLQELGLNGPYVILTSVLDVKDRMFSYNEHDFSAAKLRQNDMIFPSILITNPSDLNEYERILKELFMNAAGHFHTQYTL